MKRIKFSESLIIQINIINLIDIRDEEGFRNHKIPHSHDFYYLMYLSNGSGYHNIDFESYKVESDTVYFLSPGQVHSFDIQNAEGYILFFTTEFYGFPYGISKINEFPFFNSTINKPVLKLMQGFGEIKHLFQVLNTEFGKNDFKKKGYLRSYLEILLIELARYYKLTENEQDQNININIQRIRSLEQLINENFLEHKNVGFYAEAMNLSVRQLNKITQNSIGKSISKLINDRILIEAKRLLTHSEITASEIAWQLNFTDKTYFHRFFKGHTGLTPQQFRDKFLKVH